MARRKYTYNCVNEAKPNKNCVYCSRALTDPNGNTMSSYKIKEDKEYICLLCDIRETVE